MAQKLLFIDTETGRTTEVESFVMEDFLRGGANSPVMTGASGYISSNIVPATPPQVDVVTLTLQNINSKKLTLSSVPPNPLVATVQPGGGPVQIYGIDFKIEENFLIWEGLGLDNFLELNDILVVHY